LKFALEVVPVLQKRGLVPREYAEGTFRDRLGLPKPQNQFAHNVLTSEHQDAT